VTCSSPLLRCLTIVALLFSAAEPRARADVIILRNGQELRGRISSKGDQVRIELKLGGTVTVARGDIRETIIEKAEALAPGAASVGEALMARLTARERLHEAIEALTAQKEDTRKTAEAELVRAGRSALPLLRPALAQGTTEQRRHVLRALQAIGDVESLPAIAAILASSKSSALHVDAVEAIASIGGPAQAPQLTAVLVNSTSTPVRAAALAALIEFRSPFAAPFLVEALATPELRKAVAAALPQWSDPVILPFLLPRIDQASEPAKKAIAEWTAQLVTPAHADRLVKLISAYRDAKDVSTGLKNGIKHLITRYPVVGPIDLLASEQPAMRTLATEALRRRNIDPTDAKQLRDARQKATEPRIVFVPVGTIQKTTVADIAQTVASSPLDKTLVLAVEVDRKALKPRATGSRALDARPLLAELARRKLQDPRAARVVGVTRLLLTAPGLQTAMAPVQPGGVALVSLAGLGDTREAAVHLGRRLVLHALARSFGIPPSPVPTCPANPLYEPADLTTRTPRLSGPSEAALAAQWPIEADAAAFLYARAARKLAAMARKTPSKSALARAAYFHERDLDASSAIAQWRTYHALEKDPALKALVQKRIDLLAVTAKWLDARGLTTPAKPAR